MVSALASATYHSDSEAALPSSTIHGKASPPTARTTAATAVRRGRRAVQWGKPSVHPVTQNAATRSLSESIE